MKQQAKDKVIKEKEIAPIEITGSQILPPHENLPSNPNLPTHHADMVSFLFSSDGLTLARFFSRTPGFNIEECRVSFSQVLAKRIIDILSTQFNYYPQKSLPETGEKKSG